MRHLLQLVQQRVRVLQVPRVEALGEPGCGGSATLGLPRFRVAQRLLRIGRPGKEGIMTLMETTQLLGNRGEFAGSLAAWLFLNSHK